MERMKARVEALRVIPLFETLDDEVLGEIADLLIERKFPKGATICEEGSVGDYMYVIQEGQVKVSKASDDGRQKILEILAAGAFFGEMALLDRMPRSATVQTTRPCVLLALARQDLLALIRQNPQIALELVQELSRRLRETDEQVRGLLFERVEARTRRILMRMGQYPADDHPGRKATQAITHQQLADLVGTSRETITRVIKELKEAGWLEQQGKCYLVPTAPVAD